MIRGGQATGRWWRLEALVAFWRPLRADDGAVIGSSTERCEVVETWMLRAEVGGRRCAQGRGWRSYMAMDVIGHVFRCVVERFW